MNRPILDPRELEDLRRQVKGLAESYTPEWRLESTEDDPGAALAELFCTMFHQTVERMNELPAKLYTEFLREIGFEEPGPVPARGTMCFTPHDTVEEPVSVPAGTQVFASDEEGENIVYETQRSIQATSAQLLDIYYADPEQDQIQRLDRSCPQRFFAPGGEELQRHCLELGQDSVLRLDCPSVIRVEIQSAAKESEIELARALTEAGLNWYYFHEGSRIPFDRVREEHGRILLEKHNALSLQANEAGHLCVCCQGTPLRELTVDRVSLSSAPLAPCPAESLFFGDLPIEREEGGYCFGREPAPYDLFYLRSDTVLSKKGAKVKLALNLEAIVREPERQGPNFQYTQAVIDKKGAVEARPDDVFVAQVVWEYFNGLGWRRLEVSGDRNPFSCKKSGPLETVFQVPDDLESTEVNAEEGCYLRVRVVEVENQFSQYPRWIVPFVRAASFQWQYEEGMAADWVRAENHGESRVILDTAQYGSLGLKALSPMTPGPRAMYLCFDRSPHAMPLSLRFQVTGRAPMEEQLIWEWWNGRAFEPVRSVDQTERLCHSGEVLLFLPQPLPLSVFFGQEGCWLRVSRSARRAGATPTVTDVLPNAVTAVQCQREPEQYFDTEIYEAGKVIALLSKPVQNCRVFVDELPGMTAAEAEEMAREQPDRVTLELEEHQPVRCWVRWDLISDLALASGEDRVCVLDPYQGLIRFGDGRQGRVPPAGDHNIRVCYDSGGGQRGNLPTGAVNTLLGGLPLIADVTNVTPMSGGTGRMTREQIEGRGNRSLRLRGRAAGRHDYEDLVSMRFPQVRHVRCFTGTNGSGDPAPGHVTVVITGYGDQGERVEELCRQVYEDLSQRCSCCLVAEGRLHVRPATVLTVNTQVTVEMEQPELAADTQREMVRRLTELIEGEWKSRPIGAQIRLDEVWETIRQTPNVRFIHQVLVEGAYDRDGITRSAPLEGGTEFPFGVVENGTHQIRVR